MAATKAPDNRKIKRISEYYVVSGKTPEELAASVNSLLDEGWTVTGCLVHADRKYHQPMIRMEISQR